MGIESGSGGPAYNSAEYHEQRAQKIRAEEERRAAIEEKIRKEEAEAKELLKNEFAELSKAQMIERLREFIDALESSAHSSGSDYGDEKDHENIEKAKKRIDAILELLLQQS